MVAIAFTVNGKAVSVEAEPDTPLLWVLREHLKLTGTKFGCGIAQCGACTVHLDGEPTRDEIIAHMDGNLCRCGTYNRIIAAIESVKGA